MAIAGINTFLWTVNWENGPEPILAKIKKIGFDAIQVPILGRSTFDPLEVFTAARRLGLRCYVSAGLSADMDVTSDDLAERRRGIEFLKGCVRVAAQIEAPFLSGSFHSVFGKKPAKGVGPAEWAHSAESLKEVALAAREAGIDLVLEPINRYESFLVNTADQARTLIKMIGEPNVKIQLDTFHMNLEESSFSDTIKSVGADMVHFHVAENHRGRFGNGMLPWDEVFQALAAIKYEGAIVVESFVPEVTQVALSACIWRPMAPSADLFAQEALQLIRRMSGKYGL